MPTKITDPGSSKYYIVPVNQRIYSQVNKDCVSFASTRFPVNDLHVAYIFHKPKLNPVLLPPQHICVKSLTLQSCWHVTTLCWHKLSGHCNKLEFIPSIWQQATQWLWLKIQSKKIECKRNKGFTYIDIVSSKKGQLFQVRHRTMEFYISKNTCCDVI